MTNNIARTTIYYLDLLAYLLFGFRLHYYLLFGFVRPISDFTIYYLDSDFTTIYYLDSYDVWDLSTCLCKTTSNPTLKRNPMHNPTRNPNPKAFMSTNWYANYGSRKVPILPYLGDEGPPWLKRASKTGS